MIFPSYWDFHHPSWRSPSFFRGVGQPPTSIYISPQKLGDVLIRTSTSWQLTSLGWFWDPPWLKQQEILWPDFRGTPGELQSTEPPDRPLLMPGHRRGGTIEWQQHTCQCVSREKEMVSSSPKKRNLDSLVILFETILSLFFILWCFFETILSPFFGGSWMVAFLSIPRWKRLRSQVRSQSLTHQHPDAKGIHCSVARTNGKKHGKLYGNIWKCWLTNIYWLVVWNMAFIFPYIGNVMIPTDELNHFSEG